MTEVPGCAQHSAAELRGGLTAAAAPHRERRAALSSALCDSGRARGNGMELCQGRGSWRSGKESAPEGGGHDMGCTGQWAQWDSVGALLSDTGFEFGWSFVEARGWT